MLKVIAWLIVGAIAGTLALWWIVPTADDPPDSAAVGVVEDARLLEITQRIQSLEIASTARDDEYMELARGIEALEREIRQISDALDKERVATTSESEGTGSSGALSVRLPMIGSQEIPRNLSGVDVGPEGFVIYEVTGTTEGTVWGSGIYTDDSAISAAAVHSGMLQPGETGTVMVLILPGQEQYVGSTRNGVESRDFGEWGRSYSVQRLQ